MRWRGRALCEIRAWARGSRAGRGLMLAVVAAFRQEIGEFLNSGRFRESERPDGDWGRLRFYTSRAIPGVADRRGRLRARRRDGERSRRDRPLSLWRAGRDHLRRVLGGGEGGAEDGGSRSRQSDGCSRGAAARLAGGRRARYRNRTGRAGLQVRNALAGSDATYAVASCLTAPAFVSSPATKRRLGVEYGVSAIDMESYWAVAEASRHGTPCVPIRVILDPVEQSVSRLVENTLEDTRMRRVFRSAGYLATHPKEARELVRLSGQVKLAGKSLSDLLTRLLHEEGRIGGFRGDGS